MGRYENALARLRSAPATWLITGVAGFVGSNLLERLLHLRQTVVGIDNFATGHRRNLEEVKATVGPANWGRFHFVEGDIRDVDTCHDVCRAAEYVLHQAAIGSVPRSVADPLTTNSANVDGFLNMLIAARDAGVRRFIYATSSSTYGDHAALPKVEDRIGQPLSPYAVSKLVGELYASVFHRNYGLETIGLRYFNVFGRRQDPNGAYAAVIPRWIASLLRGERCHIFGDGETTRDFCYIENVVQANLLAALADRPDVAGEVFNIAYGGRTTLNDLYYWIATRLQQRNAGLKVGRPEYADFRAADIRHSQADISKAEDRLGYKPTHSVQQGLDEVLDWYIENVPAPVDKRATKAAIVA